MKLLLCAALCLACFVGLAANYHAAPGYLPTDSTNTTWELDSGFVLTSGFEHWDYDAHGNLLLDTSTFYSGPAVERSQTRYIVNVHGNPVESFAEYTYSNPGYFSPPVRTSTLYFYTNAERLARSIFQSDTDGDGIWDASGSGQNYYNPRGLLLRSVDNQQSWGGTSTTILEYQWSPRGDLVSYSDLSDFISPFGTNVATAHFTVRTAQDMITEDGQTDFDLDGNQTVWLEHLVERLSHGLPISWLDETFMTNGELLARVSATYTWDEHGNLLRAWSKAEYPDGSQPSQISVFDYTYVKRPFLDSNSTVSKDQQLVPTWVLRPASLKEKMLRNLPLRQRKLPNPQSTD